jgi:iduronate 2-sulfatase
MTSTTSPSMPEWFRSNGYTTVSVGKISHHPGGRGGDNWDDDAIIEMPNAWDKHLLPVGEWQHPRGIMHGLANGEIRVKEPKMDVFQSTEGDDNIYPDGLITNEALKQLNDLANSSKKPFFLAVGLIKPHLPFGAPKKYYDRYEGVELPPIAHPKKPEGQTTWHASGEFRQYNDWGKGANSNADFAQELKKHYAACVSYADAQVGKILAELKRTGADKNTIVVLWGDHGWHLGEHAIWGKHSLFEESLNSPLIISYPDMKTENVMTNAMVETLDIFPTLCNLSNIEIPSFTQGVSLKPILDSPNTQGHDAFAYYGKAETIRTSKHRLILHNDGFIELYDHNSQAKETLNLADQNPKLVKELKAKLEQRLALR